MYQYHQISHEAHERIRQRHQQAQSERIIRQSRARRRRRLQLANALDRLILIGQRARPASRGLERT